jgi:hypothetical protein
MSLDLSHIIIFMVGISTLNGMVAQKNNDRNVSTFNTG